MWVAAFIGDWRPLRGLFVRQNAVDTSSRVGFERIKLVIFHFAVLAFGLEQPNLHFVLLFFALFVGFATELFGLLPLLRFMPLAKLRNRTKEQTAKADSKSRQTAKADGGS